jgi:hypothetical protein
VGLIRLRCAEEKMHDEKKGLKNDSDGILPLVGVSWM